MTIEVRQMVIKSAVESAASESKAPVALAANGEAKAAEGEDNGHATVSIRTLLERIERLRER